MLGEITCHKYSLFSYFLVKYVYFHCELNYNSSNSQEIVGLPLHYLSSSVKTTFFNRYEDTVWPPQCHNFDSTAGAGGFTAGAAAPAVNMLEEALLHVDSSCHQRAPEANGGPYKVS